MKPPPLLEHVAAPVPSKHQPRVGHRSPGRAAAIDLRVPDQSHQRGVAAIAAACDAYALGIHPPLADGPLHCISEIVLHRQTPLLPAGDVVSLAVSQTAAKLGLDHDIAARCEELRLRAPAPAAAAQPWTAVNQNNGRARYLRLRGFRQRDPDRDFQPIARAKAMKVHGRHLGRFDVLADAADRLPLVRRYPVDPQRTGFLVGPRANQNDHCVRAATAAGQLVYPARKLRVDKFLDLFQPRVEPVRGFGVSQYPHP